MRPERKGFWLLAVLLLLTLVVRGPQLLAEGIPAGPEAFTQRELRKMALAWAQRTMTGEYKRLGRQDPSWDTQALELLELTARRYAGVPDAPTDAELVRSAEKVMATRCDDPLVLYCVGLALHRNDRLREADEYLQRAERGFLQVAYGKVWAYFAAARLANVTAWVQGKTEADVEWWTRRSIELAGESARDGSYADGEQRLFWVNMKNSLGMYKSMRQEFYDAVVGQEGTDPWIENIVAGWYHIEKAWEARGTGSAHTVTEQGWKGFAEHLQKAREHLVKAYEFHPEFPEAPAYMISVVMGGAGDPGETERLWFDRAVAAQFDYERAYDKLFWALRPRWGGSLQAMYELAVECLETKRFDTRVPLFYFETVRDIDDQEKAHDIWDMPGVHENLCTLFDGMSEQAPTPGLLKTWKSCRAVAAWRCRRYDDARQMFDALGDEVDPEAAVQFFTRLDFVRGQTYAFSEPSGPEAIRAEQLYQDDQHRTEALPVFEQLAAATTNDYARSYLHERVLILQVERDLASGEWLDIQPKADLAGWQEIYGAWQVDEQGLRATPDRQGSMLVCKSRIGANYELRGTIHFVRTRQWVQAGAFVEHHFADGRRWTSLRLYYPANEVSLGARFGVKKQTKKVPVKEDNTFLIQVWEGRVAAFINDERIFADYQVTDRAPEGESQVGLGAYHYGQFETPVWYQSLEIRRLTTQPPTPAPG